MDAPEYNDALAQLRLEEIRLRQGLVARNTILGYSSDFQIFQRFCTRFDFAALPASPETLCLYLAHSLKEGLKITTCRRRKCAIVYEHRTHGFPSPNTVQVVELLRGAQRLRAEKPRQMKPITVCDLRRMSARLAAIGTPGSMRDRALLVLGFASTLRRSTLAALRLADVEFVPQGLILSVGREKCDQQGRGRLVPIVRGQNVDSDPVRVVKAWLRLRGPIDGESPLFPRLTAPKKGLALDGQGVFRIVKRNLAHVGMDAQRGPHSLRSGAITTLGEANIGILRIGSYTSQSAETVRKYFRRSDLWRNNVSRALGL